MSRRAKKLAEVMKSSPETAQNYTKSGRSSQKDHDDEDQDDELDLMMSPRTPIGARGSKHNDGKHLNMDSENEIMFSDDGQTPASQNRRTSVLFRLRKELTDAITRGPSSTSKPRSTTQPSNPEQGSELSSPVGAFRRRLSEKISRRLSGFQDVVLQDYYPSSRVFRGSFIFGMIALVAILVSLGFVVLSASKHSSAITQNFAELRMKAGLLSHRLALSKSMNAINSVLSNVALKVDECRVIRNDSRNKLRARLEAERVDRESRYSVLRNERLAVQEKKKAARELEKKLIVQRIQQLISIAELNVRMRWLRLKSFTRKFEELSSVFSLSLFSESVKKLAANVASIGTRLVSTISDAIRWIVTLPIRISRFIMNRIRFQTALWLAGGYDTTQSTDLLFDELQYDEFERRVKDLVEQEAKRTVNAEFRARSAKKLAEEAERVIASHQTRRVRNLESVADRVIERMATGHGTKPDYALKSAGAYVLKSTPSRATQLREFVGARMMALLQNRGYKVPVPKPPSTVLMPDISPGHCWAFSGSKGSVTIHLARPALVEEIVIEHAPFRETFSVTSAPRLLSFSIVLMNGSILPVGQFEFHVGGSYSNVQTFKIQRQNNAARAVVIEVLSNHGNNAYTCLYRARVHGQPADPII
mmetsp:Transcript_6885/g.12329  ORF Transcript_6885/g.12329 Transcript_6885/m.12329 type:complete len:647 (-) Transcript_6885:196-2136(-)